MAKENKFADEILSDDELGNVAGGFIVYRLSNKQEVIKNAPDDIPTKPKYEAKIVIL